MFLEVTADPDAGRLRDDGGATPSEWVTIQAAGPVLTLRV